jgi:hypothetical protein
MNAVPHVNFLSVLPVCWYVLAQGRGRQSLFSFLRKLDPTLVVAIGVLVALGIVFLVLMGLVLFKFSAAMRYRSVEKCPSCGGPDVRPSWPSGFVDMLLEVCSCAPFRCRACRFRYYRFRQADDAAAGEPMITD